MKEFFIEEKVRFGPDITRAGRIAAHAMGKPMPRRERPIRYKNRLAGDEYLALAGGFAWPGERPGFAVILAAQQLQEDEEPIFRALAEIEHDNVEELIKGAIDLYDRCGLKECREIPFKWYGDYDNRLDDFIQKRKGRSRLALVPPPYFEEPNRFDIFCRKILSVYEKRFTPGPCTRLFAYLNQFSSNYVRGKDIDEYPAIFALGAVLTALLDYRPWFFPRDGPASTYIDFRKGRPFDPEPPPLSQSTHYTDDLFND